MMAYDPSGEIELALDPNAVPVLSASAENLQIDKLLSLRCPPTMLLFQIVHLDQTCVLDVQAGVQRSIPNHAFHDPRTSVNAALVPCAAGGTRTD